MQRPGLSQRRKHFEAQMPESKLVATRHIGGCSTRYPDTPLEVIVPLPRRHCPLSEGFCYKGCFVCDGGSHRAIIDCFGVDKLFGAVARGA